MFEAIIKSNRAILPSGIQKAAIAIENGKIAAVITDVNDELPAEITIDVGDDVLMAGIIDPHVHVNEPGRTDWEGFNSASKAALAGGITTIVDMPLNSSPVTVTAQAFDSKAIDAMKSLHTDCGFWGGIIPGNTGEIEKLVHKGVLGFKAFLTHSGIDDFPNVTEDDLRKAMPIIAKHALPLLVHCELSNDTNAFDDTSGSYNNYLKSRPKKWEDDAIALVIRLSKEFNCRVHIVHLSSSTAVPLISRAKEDGIPVTVETAQHYLFFSAEDIEDGSTLHKCAPPIREKQNNEKLWQALKDGIIDYVATDHSPAPPIRKQLETGDFSKAWGGISSLQFALPALWTAAKKRGCGPDQIAKWLCSGPSMISSPLNTKGQLKVGYDADFAIWNPDEKFIVTADIIHHRHKLTPYLNKELYGVIKQTWLAGKLVFDNGKFLHLNKGRLILNEA